MDVQPPGRWMDEPCTECDIHLKLVVLEEKGETKPIEKDFR